MNIYLPGVNLAVSVADARERRVEILVNTVVITAER